MYENRFESIIRYHYLKTKINHSVCFSKYNATFVSGNRSDADQSRKDKAIYHRAGGTYL
ncbi:MAG: hypothetical protein JWO03_807 [Bacteroidetes bacterium]|nr:hypothetical protein [Bacteroidota bacterium]